MQNQKKKKKQKNPMNTILKIQITMRYLAKKKIMFWVHLSEQSGNKPLNWNDKCNFTQSFY